MSIRRFHAAHPQIHIRVSVRSEQEIEEALREDPNVALGIAAPHEASPELDYAHLFSLDWSLITPPKHALSAKRRVKLAELVEEPLILFERGSTGRQHVVDAFHGSRRCRRRSRWKPRTRRSSYGWWKQVSVFRSCRC